MLFNSDSSSNESKCTWCDFFSPNNLFFFFNDTATTEIYTLSLHDALPICRTAAGPSRLAASCTARQRACPAPARAPRSEEHTSELQSQSNLVCRLLLEKKKNINHNEKTNERKKQT